MNKILLIVMLMAGALALTACNTMEGLGKDVSILGSKIEKKAEEKK